MRLRYKLLQWIAGLVAVIGTSPAAAQDPEELAAVAATIPVEAFFGHQPVSAPTLSPDGTKIGFLQLQNGRVGLSYYDREQDAGRLIVRAPKEDIDTFHWKGDEHLIYRAWLRDLRQVYRVGETLSAPIQGLFNDTFSWGSGRILTTQSTHPNSIIFSYFQGITDLSGENTRELRLQHTGEAILDYLSHDPERVLIKDDVVKFSNLLTGERSVVENTFFWTDYNDLHYDQLVLDGAGNIRFARRSSMEHQTFEFLYRDNNSSEWNVYWKEDWHGIRQSVSRMQISRDGFQAHVVSFHELDRGGLYRFNLEDRSFGKLVYAPPVGEIQSLLVETGSNRLIGLRHSGAEMKTVWLDKSWETLQAKLDAAFPGFDVTFANRSVDDSVALIEVSSDREAGAIYVLDRAGGSLEFFTRLYPSLDPGVMSPRKPISFVARDGMNLTGYLTTPHIVHAGNMIPMVVLTRPQPYNYIWSSKFDNVSQFLASRGYAVLQINHRGMAAAGKAHTDAGRYEIGGVMLNDLADGVSWVVEQGQVDRSRIAIMGGLMALVGATLDADRYSCLINEFGVADLEIAYRIPGADAWLDSKDFDFRNDWVGKTSAERNAISPVNNISNLRGPSLHRYGKKNFVVSTEHRDRLRRQLRKEKKQFEEVFENPDRPGYEIVAANLAWMARVEAFLAKNL